MIALPLRDGDAALDLGCGNGAQAAELAARGARVIGVDFNEDAIAVARARRLPNATFLVRDLRALELDERFDGLFCRFGAAYFVELAPVVRSWIRFLKSGAWAAFIEIDDLFGHEPLSDEVRSLFDAYAAEALKARCAAMTGRACGRSFSPVCNRRSTGRERR